MLKITPVHPSYAQAVLDFELENRAHFEQWIASRGDGFYHLEQVEKSLRQAQAQAHLAVPKEYHFLAWVEGELVGRVTLRNVEREYYFDAQLGYRFSQKHAGKGYATKAVSLVLEYASAQLGLHRIEALVIDGNQPSQKILKKCNFKQYGHSRSAVLRHAQWCDILYFELHLNHENDFVRE